MKKTFYKIGTVLGITVLIFLVDACLKDDRYVDFGAVSETIEFLDAVPGKATAYNYADPTSPDPETVLLKINQAGPNATNEDITVTVAVSQRGLDMYNVDQNHQPGVALPDSAYTFETSATIIHGKDSINNNNREAQIKLLLTPSKTPGTLGVNYVFSLEIVSAKTASGKDVIISSNRGIINFNFFHNLYDGDYKSTGSRFNFNTAADYAGWDSAAQKPLTGSVYTVSTPNPWVFAHASVGTVSPSTSYVHAGNDAAAFGTINFTVNNDNVNTVNGPASTVTVTSNCPGFDGTNGACALPQTQLGNLVQLSKVKGYYYASTKTIDLYYMYTNNTGTFRVLHDHLVKN